MVLFRLGRFAEAEQAHRNAVDIKRRRLKPTTRPSTH